MLSHRSHLLPYILYADDNNPYVVFDPKNMQEVNDVLQRLSQCIGEIKHWMSKNKLKLNGDKTEFFLACSKSVLKQLVGIKLKLSDAEISLSSSVKLLGVTFDHEMTMTSQVSNICRAANFHLYRLGKIRNLMTTSATISAVRTLVLSRMDYCNSVLNNTSESNIRKLQHVQNSAARLVTRTGRREHIMPALCNLHWLPVRARLEYKSALMTFKCLSGGAPQYLVDCVQLYSPSRSLRSSNKNLCKEVGTRKAIGHTAFSVSGPQTWNSLPGNLRSLSVTENKFKKDLKTFLFQKYFY